MKIIDRFRDDYEFLSNFYPCEVLYDKVIYPSVEHAYQAAKTKNKKERELIRKAPTASNAKQLGKMVKKRSDWNYIKINIMSLLVSRKFWSNNYLGEKLLDTGDDVLIEGNYWGDTFWGVCKGKGENHLGKILMQVRNSLRTRMK